MKVDELFETFWCQVEWMKRQSKYANDEGKLRNYQHEAYGICCAYQNILEMCDDYKSYTMRAPTKREKKEFSYYVEGNYTSFDAALNNQIYRQINPRLEEIQEGQHYKNRIRPIGIMELGGRKFPVFNDDPGQCWYIRLPSGKEIASSSFSYCPENEFLWSLFDIVMSDESGLYTKEN